VSWLLISRRQAIHLLCAVSDPQARAIPGSSDGFGGIFREFLFLLPLPSIARKGLTMRCGRSGGRDVLRVELRPKNNSKGDEKKR